MVRLELLGRLRLAFVVWLSDLWQSLSGVHVLRYGYDGLVCLFFICLCSGMPNFLLALRFLTPFGADELATVRELEFHSGFGLDLGYSVLVEGLVASSFGLLVFGLLWGR